MAQWHYTSGGQQQGPVDEQALKQMLSTGQLQPNDMVWREGMASWQPASNVPELAGGAAAAAGGYAPAPGGYAPAPGGYAPQPGYAPGYGAPGVGYATPPGYGAAVDDRWAKKATTAFILSLVGLICLGLILGIIAIVMGIQAQNGMKQTGNYKNKGLAIAAIVIGILDVIGWGAVMAMRFSR